MSGTLPQYRPPAWIRRYFDYLCSRLHFERHEIRLRMSDALEAAEYPASICTAQTASNPRYDNYEIVINRDLEPDREGYVTLTHEFLHISFSHSAQAVGRIIDMLPERLREVAGDIWTDSYENDIEHLARVLMPVLTYDLENGRKAPKWAVYLKASPPSPAKLPADLPRDVAPG